MGRIDPWEELSLFGIWDELSLGTNCRLGRIVAWDELSLETNCRPTELLGFLSEFRKPEYVIVIFRTFLHANVFERVEAF